MTTSDIYIPRRQLTDDLAGVLERSAGGSAQLVWLFGETGQGKTHFLKRFLEERREESIVSYALCSSPVGNQSTTVLKPYQPLKDILENLLLSHDNMRRRVNLVKNISLTVLACIPVVGDLAYGIKEIRRDLSEFKRGEREVDFSQFVDAYFDTLVKLSVELPVAVAIDDIQWADNPTLHAIERFLTESRFASVPVTFILSGRRDELQSSSDAFALYTRFSQTKHTSEFTVPPFTGDEIRQYYRTMFPRAGGSEDLLLWLGQKTGGNPFFLQSYIQHLQVEQLLDANGAVRGEFETYKGLPAEIKMVSRWLMKAVSEEQLHLLLTASVLGYEFSLHELSHLMQRPALELIRSLRGIQNLHGLVEQAGYRFINGMESTVYRFVQHAVHTALYNELTAEERETLHRGIARYLNDLRITSKDDPEVLDSLASALMLHARLGHQPEMEFESILLKARSTRNDLDHERLLEELRALAPSLGLGFEEIEQAYRRALAFAPVASHLRRGDPHIPVEDDLAAFDPRNVEALATVVLQVLGHLHSGRIQEAIAQIDTERRKHETRYLESHPLFSLLHAFALLKRGGDPVPALEHLRAAAAGTAFPTYAAIANVALSLFDSRAKPADALKVLQDAARAQGNHRAILQRVILYAMAELFSEKPGFKDIYDETVKRLPILTSREFMRGVYPKTAAALASALGNGGDAERKGLGIA